MLTKHSNAEIASSRQGDAMTKPLDIPPQVLERTRELTHAATDEEAILRALVAFNARGEPTSAAPVLTRAQAEAIALLGTFYSLVSDDEFKLIRGGA
jgi:hypothetical protein